MSFTLTSGMPLKAACAQYTIHNEAPVDFALLGPHSYCHLKGGLINQELKKLLDTVGIAYEEQNGAKFYNVIHTFNRCDSAAEENNGRQVSQIFDYARESIYAQTEGRLTLNLADVNSLTVAKGVEQRARGLSAIWETGSDKKAYELKITLTEEAIASAEKAGLVFRKYGIPNEQPVMHALGVGER